MYYSADISMNFIFLIVAFVVDAFLLGSVVVYICLSDSVYLMSLLR